MSAQEIRAWRNLAKRLVVTEERTKLLSSLLSRGVGLKEEEDFFRHEKSKFKGGGRMGVAEKGSKEIITQITKWKLRDSKIEGEGIRRLRNRKMNKVQVLLGPNSRKCRWIMEDIKKNCDKLRKRLRDKYKTKVERLVKEYRASETGFNNLNEEDRKTYGGSAVFQGNLVPEGVSEPAIICKEGQVIPFNKEEKSFLGLGPKFCIPDNLSEEGFEVSLEECIMKYRWQMMNEEKSKEEDWEKAIDAVIEEDQRVELKEHEELEEAKMKMVHNQEEGWIDLSKRKATDVKGNSSVRFPRKAGNFEMEARLEVLRVEAMEVYKRFMKERCMKYGKQKSNLTRGQERAMKGLKKRVEEGEIVILPTDKTGKFSVFSRECYEESGMSHTKGDIVVGWDEVKKAQREINGHVAMMIKVFKIGAAWDHTSRIRETMLGESMAVCPVSLLHKDHKVWTASDGKPPPTRHVASGNVGMGFYLSEVVSDLTEPLVSHIEGGVEVVSTEDLLAMVDRTNTRNAEWTRSSWWDGKTFEKYTACGVCEGRDWQEERIKLTSRTGIGGDEEDDTWDKLTSRTGPEGEERNSSKVDEVVEVEYCGCKRVRATHTPDEGVRVTAEVMRRLRRLDWERRMKWDPNDKDRVFTSQQVNLEDLQDFEVAMFVIGYDVISLYPNMKVDQVCEILRQAVLEADIKWDKVDYMEAVRYISLNMTAEEAASSPLRRVLPWRRGKRGTQPGMRGEGPRGATVGDTEQWCFPDVVLTGKEKRQIIAQVVSMATKAMFKHHHYKFGGKMFRQTDGGPIGLRGTCSVARVTMQMFDRKWLGGLKRLGVVTELDARYMDDGRNVLAPFRPGWRWMNGRLEYTKRWEEEDQSLTGLEITRRIWERSLGGVEEFLSFTTETGDDYSDGWLPTLDCSIKVDTSTNKILYKFYEKETASKRTVQKSTAMTEDTKIQVVSNDLLRRLMNTSDDLGEEEKRKVVTEYGQKLANSGYSAEQIQKIIVNGIRGFGSRKARCTREGRNLRRTAKESLKDRIRKKLLVKTTWFRSKRKEDYYREDANTSRKKTKVGKEEVKLENKTVLFVEYTEGGELASRLRELCRRLAPTLGFGVKIVERAGRKLRNVFPLTTLWEGVQCGREGTCITCYQGAERIIDCTKINLVYENTCLVCNEGAGGKEELCTVKQDVPTVYVGETSRSIQERGLEHHAGWKAGKASNHIYHHQTMEHQGAEPKFILRPVRYYRSALSRQVAEAVRIRRRGGEGAILNGKGEFNRCHIARLRLGEPVDEGAATREEEEALEKTDKMSEDQILAWELGRVEDKSREQLKNMKLVKMKRKGAKEPGGKRRKKLRYEQLKGWGEEPPGSSPVREHTSSTSGDNGGGSRERIPVGRAPSSEGQPPSLAGVNDCVEGPDHQVQHATFEGGGRREYTRRGVDYDAGRGDNITRGPSNEEERNSGPTQVMDNVGPFDGIETPGDQIAQQLKKEEDIETSQVSQNIDCPNIFDTGGGETTPTPVVCNTPNNTDECRIREDGLLCLSHNCVVKRIKVTSKRWNWNKKRKCYGWKSFKVDRFICMERRAGINKTQNNTSDSNDSESGLGNLGGAGRSENRHEVGGSLLNLVKNVGSESGLSALD